MILQNATLLKEKVTILCHLANMGKTCDYASDNAWYIFDVNMPMFDDEV